MLLPRSITLEQYRKIYSDSEIWLPGILEIASRHGLSGRPVRQVLGSHVVYEVGGAIVKLFCPLWLMDYRAERNALRSISGVPIPEILAEGSIEGWPYLILSKVDGIPAGEIWDSLDSEERRSILAQLGRMMRTLHEQSRSIPEGFTDTWDAFLRARIAGVLLHHGMPDPWSEWITRCLGRFEEPEMGRVLVNGDLTEDHVLLSEGAAGWEISGLIDFGDARYGETIEQDVTHPRRATIDAITRQ
jgi:hygromycin-B 7''-O-kinase